jgi:hypothetical protein
MLRTNKPNLQQDKKKYHSVNAGRDWQRDKMVNHFAQEGDANND